MRNNDNQIQPPSVFEQNDYISTVGNDTHSFVLIIRIIPHSSSSTSSFFFLVGCPVPVNCKVVDDVYPSIEMTIPSCPIRELSNIVKGDLDHVCGQASFGDMRRLLHQSCHYNTDQTLKKYCLTLLKSLYIALQLHRLPQNKLYHLVESFANRSTRCARIMFPLKMHVFST